MSAFDGLVQQLRQRVAVDRLVCGDGAQLTLQPSAFLLGLVDPLRDLYCVGARVERGAVLAQALLARGELLAQLGRSRVPGSAGLRAHRLVEGQRAAGWREALNEFAEAYPGRIR